MAETKGKKDEVAAAAKTTTSLAIRLLPVENSDQPVLANYANVNVAPGMVFIDFGFLEPAMLQALPRVAKAGGKLPESVTGKLAVRVAMGLDGVSMLHQQLSRLIASANKPRETK
jgi:hypothetical protein